MFKHVDIVAAGKVNKDSFVDDISSGGTKEECFRFKGMEDPETLACDGTMPELLSCGGWTLKAMGMSGEKDGLALQKLGRAVLGLGFSTERDQLEVRFRVNVSRHVRGDSTVPDLTLDTLHKLATAVLTRKVCFRVVSSQYDLLGIAAFLMIIL